MTQIIITKEVRQGLTYWGFAALQNNQIIYRQLPNWSTKHGAEESATFHKNKYGW